MQIRVWQQFSSNHSSFYHIVGHFNSPVEADKAFRELVAMLGAIAEWAFEYYEEAIQLAESSQFTPIEQKYAAELNIQWSRIDWLGPFLNFQRHDGKQYQRYLGDIEKIKRSIAIAGRLIFARNPMETWMTMQPFERILSALGAKTFAYDHFFLKSEKNQGLVPHNRLCFTASDESTADRLEREIRTYLEGDLESSENRPPWSDNEIIAERVLKHSAILKYEHVMYASILFDNYYQTWYRHYVRSLEEGRLNKSQVASLIQELQRERLGLKGSNPMQRDNLDFQIDDIRFAAEETLTLSAIISYLEINGCSNIDMVYAWSFADEET